jgi:hypothetical protein
MGASEDTFTKQEIQAGYVTSGCDVLARQQQILVEQQKLSGGLSATGAKLPTRKRVGGGGPSGTGKPHPNPIFPAPEFEEPIRQSAVPNIPSIPPPTSITKASTLGNPPKITQSYVNATSVPAKVGRTTSAGVLPVTVASSTTGNASTSPTVGGGNPLLRKSQSGIATASTNTAPNSTTTAASVVANRRVAISKDSADAAQQHSTLTALTPLKRNTTTIKGKPLPAVNEDENIVGSNKLPGVRNGKKQSASNSARSAAINFPANVGPPNKSLNTSEVTIPTPVSTLSELQPSSESSIIIGGDVIGPSTSSSLNGWNSSTPLNFGSTLSNTNNTIGSSSSTSSLAELGGIPIPIPSKSATTSTSTILGGDLYTGPLLNQSRDLSAAGGGGGGSSLLGGSLLNDITLSSSSNVVGGEIGLRSGSSANLWSGSILGGASTTGAGTGTSSNSNGVIGSHVSNSGLNSSSALASILGINLPTGSGSLQESLWSTTPQHRTGPSPLSMLNESTIQESQYSHSQQQFNGGVGGQLRTGIGPLHPPIQNASVIGNRVQMRSSGSSNVPISGGPGTIGGSINSQTNDYNQQNQQQSDIALLQILLPGVHITSDNSDNNAIRSGVLGWGNEPSAIGRYHGHQSIGSNRTGMISNGSGNWIVGDGSNNSSKTMVGSVIGQPNYSQQQPNQQQNPSHGSGIW